jgi:hypothetical protein
MTRFELALWLIAAFLAGALVLAIAGTRLAFI